MIARPIEQLPSIRRAHFSKARPTSRAFTLIETIVCLVLSAIVAALAVVSLRAAARPATMKAVSAELIAFDSASRRIARSFHRPLDVRVGADSLTPLDAAARVPLHLADGYTVDQIAMTAGVDASTLHYAADGRSPTYCLHVRGPAGEHHWILFAGLSGQVVEGDGDQNSGAAMVQQLTTPASLPLPVPRERVGVRVISNDERLKLSQKKIALLRNHPHPNPLPDYRERGLQKSTRLS